MDCAAPRHDAGPPVPAEGHSRLCWRCRASLSRHLRRMPHLYQELDLIPHRAPGGGRGHGDGLPYSDPVSESRSQIRHDLAWWAGHCAEDRQAAPPPFDIVSMAGWLHGCLKWMIYRQWAGDIAGAIAHDYAHALRILDPYRPVHIERKALVCPCGGQLKFTIYADDDRRSSLAECRTCESRWEPADWMTLGRKMRGITA